MKEGEGANDGRSLISNRAMEIVVALLLIGGAALVIYDSVKIGFGWREGEGPAPGYFPFWIAVILAISALVNLISALRGHGAGEIFVAVRPFGRVLAVLVPTIVFVGLIDYIGIYAASALLIFAFMMVFGRDNVFRALGVSIIVPVALFFMFEKWFLVPLPKGPIEAYLGF